MGGGVAQNELTRIVPHPRTLRKAREQVRLMVFDGLSAQSIRTYLHRWALWWVHASEIWTYEEIIQWFLAACWDATTAAYAAALSMHHVKRSRSVMPLVSLVCA
jgi:hypothetical protein